MRIIPHDGQAYKEVKKYADRVDDICGSDIGDVHGVIYRNCDILGVGSADTNAEREARKSEKEKVRILLQKVHGQEPRKRGLKTI